MYEIKSEQTVKFVEPYDHYSFSIDMPNSDLNDLILEILKGENKKSDDRWLEFVDEKKQEERNKRGFFSWFFD